MATQIRIDDTTHDALKELARAEGEPMQTIVERAVEQYRRRAFLEGLNEDFSALKADEEEWDDELAERALWDKTLLDGVESE